MSADESPLSKLLESLPGWVRTRPGAAAGVGALVVLVVLILLSSGGGDGADTEIVGADSSEADDSGAAESATTTTAESATTTTAAPPTTTTTEPPPPSGSAVFSANCAWCHGAGGAGLDPLVGPVLVENSLGPGAILNTVQIGSGDPFMPAFGNEGLLTLEEIQAVIQYVNGL